MKLYMSTTSPFVRKVRLYAIQLGLGDKIENINTVVGPEKINDEYKAINPLLQVPSLITDDGILLSDSYIICDHLARLAGDNMFPTTGTARDEALQTHALINGTLDALVQALYEKLKRPAEYQWEGQITSRTAKANGAMALLAQGPSGLFEVGEKLTMTQCAFISLIDWAHFRLPHLGYKEMSGIAEFMQATESFEGVEATLPA